jgi:hypothetical protein
MRTRHALAATTSILAGLLFTACTSATSHTAASMATDGSTTGPTTASTVVDVTTPSRGTTDFDLDLATTTTLPAPVTTAHSPAPAPAPAPAPVPAPDPTPTTAAPSTTLGSPPMVAPPITLVPIVLFPTVNTLTGQTHFTCLSAALAGYQVQVSWSATFTSGVTIAVDSVPYILGAAAVGTTFIPISCGDSQTVTVYALWPDGSAAGSRTILVKVDPF